MYEILMKLRAYSELILAVALIYQGITFQYHSILVDLICIVTGICFLLAAAKVFDKLNGYGQRNKNKTRKT